MDGLQAPSSGVRFAASSFLLSDNRTGACSLLTRRLAIGSQADTFSRLTQGEQLVDYPLKPTEADLNDESLDAQEPEVVEVYAWQADEPVMTVEVPPLTDFETVQDHLASYGPSQDRQESLAALYRIASDVERLESEKRAWMERIHEPLAAEAKEMRFALEAHHANVWENCPICDSKIGIINRS